MKRRFAIGTLLALVLVMGITVAAMAAGPGPNPANGAATGIAGQGAALHGTFVDEDSDGICDDYAMRVPAEDGTGNRWGGGQGLQAYQATPGAGFVDDDGDWSPPQVGIGRQMRRGGLWNQ